MNIKTETSNRDNNTINKAFKYTSHLADFLSFVKIFSKFMEKHLSQFYYSFNILNYLCDLSLYVHVLVCTNHVIKHEREEKQVV